MFRSSGLPCRSPPSPLTNPANNVHYTRFSDHQQPFSLRIITGNSNPQLAEDVASLVGYEMRRGADGKLLTPKTFANGEIDVKYVTCLRGDDVFIVQPTCPSEGRSVNCSLMELLLMVHTAHLASAERVVGVVPYIAYGRQSSMTSEGTPIAAAAVAKLLMAMHVNALVTVDLNSSQIQGFFHNIPVTNLSSTPIFRKYLQTRILRGDLPPVDQLVMVAVGHHNIAQTRELGDALGIWKYTTILHRRIATEIVAGRPPKVLQMDGTTQCQGMVCIMVDDVVDTMLITQQAVQLLMEAGAHYVIACATHAPFVADALERVMECEGLRECIVTDTTPQAEHQVQCPKLHVLTVSPLLSMAVKRIHHEVADKEDDWDTRDWNEYDFDLATCPISMTEQTMNFPGVPISPQSGNLLTFVNSQDTV